MHTARTMKTDVRVKPHSLPLYAVHMQNLTLLSALSLAKPPDYKRSTYDSNQARTKPRPTRLPTSDNNLPITKRIRTNETQNVSLTLATVEDCRRKQGDGTVGTRAVVS